MHYDTSHVDRRSRARGLLLGLAVALALPTIAAAQTPQIPDGRASDQANARPSGICGVCAADRKSTRLNSSHQIISYAVFCLKKKKKTSKSEIKTNKTNSTT